MLVLAPATCCLGGIAADQILNTFCKSIRPEEGSGGWVGLIKTWMDGEESAAQSDSVSVDSRPASSSTSSAPSGKRQKSGKASFPAANGLSVRQSINQSINQSMHMLGLQDSSEESTDNKLERKDVWEQMDAMCISVASLFIGCVGGLG